MKPANQINKQEPKNQPRRTFLRQLTSLLGSSAAYTLLAGDSLSVALAYTPKAATDISSGLLFTQAQMTLLHKLCDIILPRTATPSGGDVDCHGFVDHQLHHCFNKQQQQMCLEIINVITKHSQQMYHQSYTDLPLTLQSELLLAIEQKHGFTAKDKEKFKWLKSLIVFGYFTSEAGATKALNYQAVPGGYLASIPYDEHSKAWGSLSYY